LCERERKASRSGQVERRNDAALTGWTKAADLILKGLNGAIGSKRITCDFARQMEGATRFGDNNLAPL